VAAGTEHGADDADDTRDAARTLGLGATTSLLIGSVIGSGIFILPGVMTAQLPSPPWVLAAFAAGAVVSIAGALTLAELGGMFPQEGGQSVYLERTLGRGWSFLFGWTAFWVVQTGVIAAISLAFGRFAGILFGYDDAVTTAFVAVAAIALLTLVNVLGIRQGSFLQNLLTVAKVAGIAVLVIAAFIAGKGEHAWLSPSMPAERGLDLAGAFGIAALAGIFAYDGWYVVTYVARDVKRPQRTIPVALALGMLVVAAVYLVTVLAYFWVLPAGEVAAIGDDGNSRISAEVARAVLGAGGATFIAVVVMLSTLGATNGQVLTGPRLFSGLARHGLWWQAFGRRGRFATPTIGLVLQGEWAAMLVMVSVFARDAYIAVVNSVVFAIWLWFIPTAIGYFRMRRREPDRPRPYRTWGHPIVPALFLAAAVAIVANAVVQDVRLLGAGGVAALPQTTSVWALALIAVGAPLVPRVTQRASHGRAAADAPKDADAWNDADAPLSPTKRTPRRRRRAPPRP
jgi:amino acid transporter